MDLQEVLFHRLCHKKATSPKGYTLKRLLPQNATTQKGNALKGLYPRKATSQKGYILNGYTHNGCSPNRLHPIEAKTQKAYL